MGDVDDEVFLGGVLLGDGVERVFFPFFAVGAMVTTGTCFILAIFGDF